VSFRRKHVVTFAIPTSRHALQLVRHTATGVIGGCRRSQLHHRRPIAPTTAIARQTAIVEYLQHALRLQHVQKYTTLTPSGCAMLGKITPGMSASRSRSPST